ncbi:MAG: hypothetical protein LBG09_03385 [Puniceicoccales bacterium]|nr:hypothetical protein [Puniceicoccales bacterium]
MTAIEFVEWRHDFRKELETFGIKVNALDISSGRKQLYENLIPVGGELDTLGASIQKISDKLGEFKSKLTGKEQLNFKLGAEHLSKKIRFYRDSVKKWKENIRKLEKEDVADVGKWKTTILDDVENLKRKLKVPAKEGTILEKSSDVKPRPDGASSQEEESQKRKEIAELQRQIKGIKEREGELGRDSDKGSNNDLPPNLDELVESATSDSEGENSSSESESPPPQPSSKKKAGSGSKPNFSHQTINPKSRRTSPPLSQDTEINQELADWFKTGKGSERLTIDFVNDFPLENRVALGVWLNEEGRQVKVGRKKVIFRNAKWGSGEAVAIVDVLVNLRKAKYNDDKGALYGAILKGVTEIEIKKRQTADENES